MDLFKGSPGEKVNTSTFSGKTVIFGVPGAFTPTCHKVIFLTYLRITKEKDTNTSNDKLIYRLS